MTREDLLNLFQFNEFVLSKNLDGLTPADSLVQATAGGSTIHWTIGHLLATRNGALRLLGEAPVWTEEQAAAFARGSRAHDWEHVPVPFEQLLADLRLSSDRIRSAIDRITEKDLAAPLGQGRDGSVGDQLARLHYHEGYHAGQMGLLRRIAGRAAGLQ